MNLEKPKKSSTNHFEDFQTDDYNHYGKDVPIEGLTYHIVFSEFNPFMDTRKNNFTMYSLDFSTKEHGLGLTNKGILVFSKLVNEMRSFFDEISSKQNIDAITFMPSSTLLNTEEEAQMHNVGIGIEQKLKDNNHLLDGFFKDQNGQIISIEDGYMNLSGDFQKPGSFSIRAIVDDTINPPDLPEWFKPAIWQFIHKDEVDEDLLAKLVDSSQRGANQRLALYRRALERNFSEYEFDLIKNTKRIVIYINKDKKDLIKKAMFEAYEPRNT